MKCPVPEAPLMCYSIPLAWSDHDGLVPAAGALQGEPRAHLDPAAVQRHGQCVDALHPSHTVARRALSVHTTSRREQPCYAGMPGGSIPLNGTFPVSGRHGRHRRRSIRKIDHSRAPPPWKGATTCGNVDPTGGVSRTRHPPSSAPSPFVRVSADGSWPSRRNPRSTGKAPGPRGVGAGQ